MKYNPVQILKTVAFIEEIFSMSLPLTEAQKRRARALVGVVPEVAGIGLRDIPPQLHRLMRGACHLHGLMVPEAFSDAPRPLAKRLANELLADLVGDGFLALVAGAQPAQVGKRVGQGEPTDGASVQGGRLGRAHGKPSTKASLKRKPQPGAS